MGTHKAPEEMQPMPPSGRWPSGTTGQADGMWKVISGSVEVWRENLMIGVRYEGDYIGALGLLYKPSADWTLKPGPTDQQLATFLHARTDAVVEPLSAPALAAQI